MPTDNLSRRDLLKKGLILGGGALGAALAWSKDSLEHRCNRHKMAENQAAVPQRRMVGKVLTRQKPLQYGVKQKIIIPGCKSYDIDGMRFTGSRNLYELSLNQFDVKKNFDDSEMVFGADQEKADIVWQYINRSEQRLVPYHKSETELANLCVRDFDKVDIGMLTSSQILAKYSKRGISGNQLKPRTVIAIKTNKGYAKLRVDGYIPRQYKKSILQRVFGGGKSDRLNYNIKCTLVVYAPK